MPLLLESSDEEDEEEEAEAQAPSGVDTSFEATAARLLAKSATQAYLRKLQEQCVEAAGNPELQRKQREALAEHAARHPEMQPVRKTPDVGSQSPAKVDSSPVESPTQVPVREEVPEPSPQPPSPVQQETSGKEDGEDPKPEPSQPSPKKSPKKSGVPSPKRQAKGTTKPSPSSPKRPPSRPRRNPESPSRGPQPHAPSGAPSAPSAPKPGLPGPQAAHKKAAPALGATSSTLEPSPKAEASFSNLDDTALSLEMQLQAGYGTASLTQLPSSTWRGAGQSHGEEREKFLTHLSKHKSMPLITFLPRRNGDLWPTNANPAPGTYPPKDESRTSKYQAPRQVSFGFSRRFSRWPQNAEKKPGPGAHSVANFERFKYAEPTGRSFSRAPRGRPNPIRQTGPGPGAYGTKFGSAEEGPAVTMVGKFRKRGVLNYDEPGPGAYDPSTVLSHPTAAAVGFATALREDFYPKEDKQKPAPGAYHDGYLNNPLGSDCLAFSMTGKRRKHDLTRHLYADPGPGFYKHGSSFGYSSTWVKPQAQQTGSVESPH